MAQRAGHAAVPGIPVGRGVGRESPGSLRPAICVGSCLGMAAAALGRRSRPALKAGGARAAMTGLAGGQILLRRKAMEGGACRRGPDRTQGMRHRFGPMAQGIVEAARRCARRSGRGGMPCGVGHRAGVVALGADRRVRGIRRGMVGARGVVPGLRRVRGRDPVAGCAGLDGSVGSGQTRGEVRPMAGLAGRQPAA